MAKDYDPRIVSSDHLDNGLVVNFSDGKSAFYSAVLLYAVLPQAKDMPSEHETGGLPFLVREGATGH
jgi:hypothetical protein